MISCGILTLIVLVLYFVFKSLSETYVMLEAVLPVLMWAAVILGVITVVFIIVNLIKTISK